jgi:hypothetical protein
MPAKKKMKHADADGTEKEPVFDVEAVLERREVDGGPGSEFLVRWRGYGEERDSWEPRANLDGAKGLLKKFEVHEKKKEKKALKRSRKVPHVHESTSCDCSLSTCCSLLADKTCIQVAGAVEARKAAALKRGEAPIHPGFAFDKVEIDEFADAEQGSSAADIEKEKDRLYQSTKEIGQRFAASSAQLRALERWDIEGQPFVATIKNSGTGRHKEGCVHRSTPAHTPPVAFTTMVLINKDCVCLGWLLCCP